MEKSDVDGPGEGASPPDDVAGTRAELVGMLADAGYAKLEWWVDTRTPLLSGLVPSEAITNPATAARARRATRRFLARLPDPIPDLVRVVSARLIEPDGFLVELDFKWPGGESRRRMDFLPYLWEPAFERLREDQAEFAELYVDLGAVCWPGGIDMAPEFVFGESWSVDSNVRTIDLELSPAARLLGVAYLHDVDLDDGQTLSVGDRVRVRDEGGDLWEAAVADREEVPRGLGHKYRLRIEPADVPTGDGGSTTAARRDLLQRRATWLTQLGLTGDDPVPVRAIEGLAHGALALLAEVERLERERAEARAWAWAGHHGTLEWDWVGVAGNVYAGEPNQLPDWLASPVEPDQQHWWPT